MEIPPSNSPSRWLLFTIDQQGWAVQAAALKAVYPSCLAEYPDRYCAFLDAQLHEGRPIFMRPLTELFKLADPHCFVASRPRPWCLVTPSPQGLGCWVDEVTGPIAAVPALGQIFHQQRHYQTALPAHPQP